MINEIKRAKQDHFVITELYPKLIHDEQEYNMLCYHIEQCIEELLKALIAMKGEIYPYTHNIMKLCKQIDQLYSNNIEILNFINNEIKPRATMYISWESQSRYNEDFIELRKNIDDSLIVIDNLFTIVENEEQI